jgi:hypothetical protein
MAKKIFTDFDFQSVSKVINLPSPSGNGDAATKSYVDSLVEGLAWKDSCRVATQSNLNLSSPGATIDGITMASQDRVLVRSQTTASQNGIYVWNGSSSAMTRSLDANTFAELEAAVLTVEEGTSAGTSYRQDQVNGTIDSSTVTWQTFGTAAPSASTTTAGVVRLATQSEVNTGTDATIAVTPSTLASWSGRVKKYATSIGDGSATSYTVTHNLASLDVNVTVFNNSTGDEVITDVTHATTNTLTIVFASAPASNAYRVVVIG